jgi:hypothetical protein
MIRKMKTILVLASAVATWAADPVVSLPESVKKLDLSGAEGIAVLSGGRVKPLLVAAIEGVQEIRGRAGLTRDLDPMRSWFSLALYGDTLSRQRIVFCANKPLRKEIGLDADGQFASFDELASNAKLRALTEAADAKDRQKLRLSGLEKAARETARRLEKFAEARTGTGWRLLPGPPGKEAMWRLPQEIPMEEIASHRGMLEQAGAVRKLLLSFAAGDQTSFDSAASSLSENAALTDSLSSLGGGQFLAHPAGPRGSRARAGASAALPLGLDPSHVLVLGGMDRADRFEVLVANLQARHHRGRILRNRGPGPVGWRIRPARVRLGSRPGHQHVRNHPLGGFRGHSVRFAHRTALPLPRGLGRRGGCRLGRVPVGRQPPPPCSILPSSRWFPCSGTTSG